MRGGWAAGAVLFTLVGILALAAVFGDGRPCLQYGMTTVVVGGTTYEPEHLVQVPICVRYGKG